MIEKLMNYQFLFEELVKRDFKKKYKRTVLGMVWQCVHLHQGECAQVSVFILQECTDAHQFRPVIVRVFCVLCAGSDHLYLEIHSAALPHCLPCAV